MLLKLLIFLAICNYSRASPVCPQNYYSVNGHCYPIPNYESKAQPQLPSCPLNYYFSNGYCYHNSNHEQVPVIDPQRLCSGSNCFQNSQVTLQPSSSVICQQNSQLCTSNCQQNSHPCTASCQQNSQPCTAPCQGNSQPCNQTPCSQPSPPCETPPCQKNPQPCEPPCEQNPQPCIQTPCPQPSAQCNSPPCQQNPQPCKLPCEEIPQPCNVPCQQCPKSCAVIPPNLPCPQPPYYPPPIIPIITTTPSTTTTTSTTTIRPVARTTTQKPPEPLIICPENTIFLNGECRVVYCGKGIYKSGKCVQTVCPEGTFWTGYKCEVPEPIVHDISLNHTTINNYNFRAPDVIVHNMETVNVNASLNIPISISIPPENPPEQSCCEVRTPRICNSNESKKNWNCFSKSERLCGDFCTTPVINLKPSRVQYRQPYLVMPPAAMYVGKPSWMFSQSPYDCSSCLHRFPHGCPPFCYNYDCNQPSCSFLDQRSFCNQHSGQFGCVQEDGCFDDWCSNGYN